MGPGLRQSQEQQQLAYQYSKCMTCGCCLEACPQFLKIELVRKPGETAEAFRARQREANMRAFMGAHAIAQVELFNSNPIGADERHASGSTRLIGRGGDPGLRQRAELREGLSEGNPLDHGDRPRRPRRDVPRSEEVAGPVGEDYGGSLRSVLPMARHSRSAAAARPLPAARRGDLRDDPEVLQNAADRQMAHVRTFQTGRHSAESQQLLNELAAAKLCLLNAQKKAGYDALLRIEQAGAELTAGRALSRCDTPGESSADAAAERRPQRASSFSKMALTAALSGGVLPRPRPRVSAHF